MIAKLVALASLSCVLLAPSLAAAQEVASETSAMGTRGTLVLGADLRGIVDHTSSDGEQSESESWTIGLRPSLDYFVTDSFSLGGTVLLQNQRQTIEYDAELGIGDTENTVTSVGASLRLGVHATVASSVSVWVRAGAGLEHAEGQHDPSDDFGGDTSSDSYFLDGSALLLVHVAPHFFLAAGPGVVYRDNQAKFDSDVDETDIESESDSTSIGLRVEIGGYW